MTPKENSGAAKLPMRRGGKAARIAVIPGDGIGKEVTPEAVKVLRAVAAPAQRQMEFIEFDWGADKYLREEVTLPAGADEIVGGGVCAILFGGRCGPPGPPPPHPPDIFLGVRVQPAPSPNPRPVLSGYHRGTPR